MAFPEKQTRRTPKGKKAPIHQDAALRGRNTKKARDFVKNGPKVMKNKERKRMVRRKRVTQEDAQFMLDWLDAMNEIHTGFVSPKLKAQFERADKIRFKEHRRIFGDPNTQWTIVRDSRGRRRIEER